ncbi:hypothetical protein D3C72_2505730 [compost metagenome]
MAHLRDHGLAAAPAHETRLGAGHAVTALLQLAHHGKGGVLVDLEGLNGIGNEEDVHGVSVF